MTAQLGRWIALGACCIALGACRREEGSPPPRAAPSAVTPADRHTIRASIHPQLPEYAFTLVAQPQTEPRDVLRVQRIEIRRGTTPDPTQTITDLDTRTPLNAGKPAFEVLDMNFDGYRDIRIVEFLPAGPNVPYRNWLFDPTSGRFVGSPALDEIPAAEYLPAAQEIRSHSREGPNRYATDISVHAAGRPVIVRKESKVYSAPGVFTLRVSKLVEGRWVVAAEREGRDP